MARNGHVRCSKKGDVVPGRRQIQIAFYGAFAVLLSACGPGQPVSDQPTSTTVRITPTTGRTVCAVEGHCGASSNVSSSPVPATAEPSSPSPQYSSPTPPPAGWPAPPVTPAPRAPQSDYFCPTGTLVIGVSYVTATAPGEQVDAVITGSALNLSSEDVLVPLPSVYAIDGVGLKRTPEWTTSGAFEYAAGQTVVRLRSGESRNMKFSISMSGTDFRATQFWSMLFENGGFKYASPESQAHGCAVRVDAQPASIPNTLGTEWFR